MLLVILEIILYSRLMSTVEEVCTLEKPPFGTLGNVSGADILLTHSPVGRWHCIETWRSGRCVHQTDGLLQWLYEKCGDWTDHCGSFHSFVHLSFHCQSLLVRVSAADDWACNAWQTRGFGGHMLPAESNNRISLRTSRWDRKSPDHLIKKFRDRSEPFLARTHTRTQNHPTRIRNPPEAIKQQEEGEHVTPLYVRYLFHFKM